MVFIFLFLTEEFLSWREPKDVEAVSCQNQSSNTNNTSGHSDRSKAACVNFAITSVVICFCIHFRGSQDITSIFILEAAKTYFYSLCSAKKLKDHGKYEKKRKIQSKGNRMTRVCTNSSNSNMCYCSSIVCNNRTED